MMSGAGHPAVSSFFAAEFFFEDSAMYRMLALLPVIFLSMIAETVVAQDTLDLEDSFIVNDSVRVNPDTDQTSAFIEFYDSQAFHPFFRKWKNNSRITIAHFGDSHVQPDISTGVLRTFIQSVKGNGGRGFIFPYASAHTHSGFDYRTESGGFWQTARNIEPIPRLPLGVSGYTVRTTDPQAWASFAFRSEMPKGKYTLKIFCRRNTGSFGLKLETETETFFVPVADSTSKGHVEITLPYAPDRFTLRMDKQNDQQNEFEIYGLSIESDNPTGALVHAFGTIGAPWRGLLMESLFEEQMRLLNVDLVILDYGTNDFLVGNRIPADMSIRIVDAIRKVRKALPQATIVLATTQDMNRRRYNITSARPMAKLLRTIAQQENCALFDWYWIAGGPGSMSKWVNDRLAQRDNIHLTGAGYKLKGELLTAAFSNTLDKLNRNPGLTQIVQERDSISLPQLMARDNNREVPAAPTRYNRDALPNGELINHRVRSGESLSTIAQKYGVTVRSIQELNGIRGTRIIAGKSLKVIVRGPVTAQKNQEPKQKSSAPKPIAKTDRKGTIKHTIVAGETLYSIADKYNTSVEKIKTTNGLKSSNIVAGQSLLIEMSADTDRKNKS